MKLILIFSRVFWVFIFLYIITCKGLHAQNIFVSAGNIVKTSNNSINWIIGESVVKTYTVTGTPLSQGSLQSKPGMKSDNNMSGFSVFPNPTKENILLKAESEKIGDYSYRIYDITGRMLEEKLLETNETQIILSVLKPSVYFLKIVKDGKEVKVFKVVKQ